MPDIYSTTFAGAQRLTPSDATTYTAIRGLIVDAVGTLHVKDLAGNDITYAAVVVGQYIPHAVSQVMQTGTTATVIGLS